jgi:mannose-6-phosphate isomerase-like protein (cupin superfamily)
MTTAIHATVTRKNEGRPLWVPRFVLRDQGHGPRDRGPPDRRRDDVCTGQADSAAAPHNCGEAVYVLEGTIRCHVDDQVLEAAPGDFLCFPEGTLEWMENPTTVPAWALVIYPGTLSRWERNLRIPTGRYARLAEAFLGP